MASVIEAVLFDFGGVFTGSPFRAVDGAAEKLGASAGAVREIVFGPYDRDTEHPWHRLERGEIPLASALREISALGADRGVAVDPLELLAGTRIDERNLELLVERVRGLRRDGYRTAIVTNNVAEFSQGWRSLIPVDELFDIVVDSSTEGVRKPNPAIYRIALERLGGVAPDRAVFLDDFEENVRVAAQLGMRAILVAEDIPAVIAALDRHLSAAPDSLGDTS